MPDRILILSLGSNLGNRLHYLAQARRELTTRLGMELEEGLIMETEPWGVENHPAYLNQIVLAKSDLTGPEILRHTQSIEREMGRDQKGLLQARTMDIDILYLGAEIWNLPELIIPHPRISERRFILEPLNALIPDFPDPKTGLTIRQMLENCRDTCRIWPYSPEPQDPVRTEF